MIHCLSGWLIRQSHHFVMLQDSENGKVQKSQPQRQLQRETALGYPNHHFHHFTDKRNVLGHFGHVRFIIRELGWPGFPSEI